MARKSKTLPTYICRIPAALKLDELRRNQPPSFQPFRSDIVATICEYWYRRAAHKPCRREPDRFDAFDDFISLHSHDLQTLSDSYRKYVDWLCSVGVHVFTPLDTYQPDKYSKSYRLADRLRDGTENVVLTDTIAIKAFGRYEAGWWQRAGDEREDSIAPRPGDEPRTSFSHTSGDVWIVDDAWYDVLDETRAEPCDLSLHIVQRAWQDAFGESFESAMERYQIERAKVPNVRESVPVPRGKDAHLTYQWLYDSVATMGIIPGWEDAAHHLRTTKPESFGASKLEAVRTTMGEIERSIQRRSFRFKVSGEGRRIYTAITQMPKPFRTYLTLDGGDDLVSIDLKSSQPYFLLAMARHFGLSTAAVEQFEADVRNDIYAVLGDTMYGEYTVDMRPSLKEEMMRVLFSRNEQEHPAKEAFQYLHPEIDGLLRAIKGAGHYTHCAQLMQRVEADFITRIVANALRLERIPLWTVHDCVIVKREHQHVVTETIRRLGEGFTGFAPRWSVEPLQRMSVSPREA